MGWDKYTKYDDKMGWYDGDRTEIGRENEIRVGIYVISEFYFPPLLNFLI